MITLLTTSPHEAAEIIRSGGIVAFPTETVYGLGAAVFDEDAIGKVFAAKRRPPDNPLIAHIGSHRQFDLLAEDIRAYAARMIESFFPGPLTIVVKKTARLPDIATAGLDTIGIRMPRHPLAQQLLKAADVPLAAPSANLSGRPSPTTWRAVHEDLDGRIDCILQGDSTDIGLESTVVDCTGDLPVVLRKGAVSLEALRMVVPDTRDASTGDIAKGKSPGLRHRHYSPDARIVLVEPGETIDASVTDSYIGTTVPSGRFGHIVVVDSVDDYARDLFEFFRESDRREIRTIYCETVSEVGIGAALMDRLRRAAEND